MTSASSDGDVAYIWIMDVEDFGKSIDDFADASRFPSLDAKLMTALCLVANDELGRQINLELERHAARRVRFRGRQALRMIYEYFKLDEAAGTLYSIQDLSAVRLRNAADLGRFIGAWDRVIAGLQEMQSEHTLVALFLDQLRNGNAIQLDVAHYIRLEPGHPEKTYDWLYRQCQRELARKRSEAHRDKERKYLAGQNAPGAPAPKTGAKSKGVPKGFCYAFARGECTAGDACKFSHAKPSGAKGAGKSEPKTAKEKKETPCRFFWNGPSGCNMGDTCQFSHLEKHKQKAKPNAKTGAQKKKDKGPAAPAGNTTAAPKAKAQSTPAAGSSSTSAVAPRAMTGVAGTWLQSPSADGRLRRQSPPTEERGLTATLRTLEAQATLCPART